MKILALVVARHGSKRLPGKNTRLLGGVPLIVWSIEAVQGIVGICDILVSTDDRLTAQIALDAGAMVPWLRPAELATDTASVVDVGIHALDWYEDAKGKIDGLLLLQPTTPFRSRETVSRGIELFRLSGGRPILSLSPAKSHPMRCYRIVGETMQAFMAGGEPHIRSQDLPPAHVVNGALYIIAPEDLRRRRSYYSDAMVPLPVDAENEGIDIDTEWDWRLAEAILRAK